MCVESIETVIQQDRWDVARTLVSILFIWIPFYEHQCADPNSETKNRRKEKHTQHQMARNRQQLAAEVDEHLGIISEVLHYYVTHGSQDQAKKAPEAAYNMQNQLEHWFEEDKDELNAVMEQAEKNAWHKKAYQAERKQAKTKQRTSPTRVASRSQQRRF